MTREKTTEQNYIKRYNILQRQSKKELNILLKDDIDIRQFVGWLASKRLSYGKSTWRQYKNSCIYSIGLQEQTDAHTEALLFLSELTSNGCQTKTLNTSGQKLKKIPIKDLDKIMNHLENYDGKWHIALKEWLLSGIITGLRPQEWINANFVKEEKYDTLVVKNAKNTNGRAHGETRTIVLSKLTENEKITIKNHLSRIKTFYSIDEYNSFYDHCAFSLYYINRKLFPNRKKHITLYSTRHQFSANAKSSGFSKAEIAAMMGHANDITATKHYGKKVSGNEELKVSAISADIAKVKQTYIGHPAQNPNNNLKGTTSE